MNKTGHTIITKLKIGELKTQPRQSSIKNNTVRIFIKKHYIMTNDFHEYKWRKNARQSFFMTELGFWDRTLS